MAKELLLASQMLINIFQQKCDIVKNLNLFILYKLMDFISFILKLSYNP